MKTEEREDVLILVDIDTSLRILRKYVEERERRTLERIMKLIEIMENRRGITVTGREKRDGLR